jgi:hypothetical protein
VLKIVLHAQLLVNVILLDVIQDFSTIKLQKRVVKDVLTIAQVVAQLMVKVLVMLATPDLVSLLLIQFILVVVAMLVANQIHLAILQVQENVMLEIVLLDSKMIQVIIVFLVVLLQIKVVQLVQYQVQLLLAHYARMAIYWMDQLAFLALLQVLMVKLQLDMMPKLNHAHMLQVL